VKQVHGTDVHLVEQAGIHGTGDGLICSSSGLLVGVKTADCIPILLVDPEHRVVAAIHAGWRGTAAGIAGKSVDLMAQRFGSDPSRIAAAIGPGIGLCCFEVGPEVAREFGPWDSDAKCRLDLPSVNREQLADAGVKSIYESGLCTMCGTGFFSFRREKERAGRMLSYVGRVA
jgi:YfiH family protein